MSQATKPVGHFPVPFITFGFVSLLLGVATEMMGVFDGLTASLREVWKSGGLGFEAEMGLPGIVGVMISSAASFGVIAAILGTPGTGRRLVLGVSALILVVALIPAFAVWGIFWKPFGVILSVVWAWFSGMIYTGTHFMPCERGEEPVDKNVIRLEGDHMTQQHSNQADG